MMKKSLCVVFVLALIAQICARPADEKVDPKTKAEDAVATATTDAKDKKTEEVHKAADGANKHPGSDIIKRGEGVAESAKKNGEECHKGAKGHHGGIFPDSIKKVSAIGEEFVKRGENILENIFKKWASK